MRIAFFIGQLAVGGAERQLVQLAAGLGRRDHEVTVVTLYPGGALSPELEGEPVTAVHLSPPSGGSRGRALRALLAAPGGLRRVLRARRAEVLYSVLYPSNAIAALAVGRRPRWPWLCGLRASRMRLNPLRAFFFRLNARWSSRAAILVANSQSGLDYHRARGFRAARELVIANGIDTDRFRPAPELGAALRAELGIASEARVIGRVGRLDPVKGYPTFLDAAARLVREAEDRSGELVFVCVGGGPAAVRRELEAHGAGGARVIWAGERADMPAVYNAFDVAVSSSLGEGFPNVVAEAMACGVPCVATDVGDSARLIGDLGRTVPAGDVGALGEAIAGVLASPPPAERCRARIVERYSVAGLVAATEDALRLAIRSHPRIAQP